MISPTTLIIGAVSGVSGTNAWIVPVRTHGDSTWRHAKAEDFPPGGDVFWEHARYGLEVNDVVAVTVRRNSGKNAWAVEREVECRRLIDYTDKTYESVLRLWHQQPLKVNRPQGEQAVLIACRGSLVLGPLRAKAHSGDLVLDTSQHLHLIQANRCPQAIVDLDKHGLWMVPDLQRSSSFVIDARTDAEVLRSAMSDARKILGDQKAPVPAAIETKNAIAGSLKLIADSDIDRTKIERLKRALAIVDQWEETRLRAADLEREIQALPDTVAILDRLRAAVTIDVRASAEAELARESADAHEALNAARAETTELHAQASTLRDELSRTDDLVQRRIAEYSSDAAKAVSESILLSALAQTHSTQYQPPRSATAPAQLRTIRAFGEANSSIPTKSAAAFAEAGLEENSVDVLRRIHAAIAARLVPILLGSGARQALATYARAAMAGRTISIPVAHDFLQPVDLLGIVAETGTLARPHGDLLLAANNEVSASQPGLVVLDGFNRGATESYLVPWLTEPTQSIHIEPAARQEFDQHQFTRDPNLAVAAIATVGATSARIGPDLWSRAVLIDVPAWSLPSQEVPLLSRIPVSARPSPRAVIVAEEAMNGSVEVANQWWQIDAGVLEATQKFAGALADVRGKAAPANLIRRALAECALLPPLAVDLAPTEVHAAVATVSEWAAPGDDDFQQRLLRRAYRASRAFG